MKKTLLVLSILAITSMLFAKPVWCRNAHTYVEKRICNSGSLIDLDYELSNIYSRLKGMLKRYDYSKYRSLIKDEKIWVRERNTDCYRKSNSCIKNKYEQRIDYLYYFLNSLEGRRV